MDPEYGTKRRAVPLLVEDVAGSQTSVKVEEIGAKVDKLESIIESTVPRGCLSHWRIVNQETGELINQGMLDNTLNITGQPGNGCSVISYQPSITPTTNPTIALVTAARDSNVTFLISKVNTYTQKVELYNPYDTTVNVFEVTTTFKNITTPIYLKHLPPYPSRYGPEKDFYYTNGRDVCLLQRAMGTESSSESSNTVVGLLKSISNKL